MSVSGVREAGDPRLLGPWSRIGDIALCNCLVKVGRGAQSLPADSANFEKPWLIIYLQHHRVASFYFALKYVD